MERPLKFAEELMGLAQNNDSEFSLTENRLLQLAGSAIACRAIAIFQA